MTPATNQAAAADLPGLAAFEMPHFMVEAAVRAARSGNTQLDKVFYDVPGLLADFAELDEAMRAAGKKLPSRIVDFDALANPEGALLLIDATTAPYVHRFYSVDAYLNSPHRETRAVEIVSVTGVGSSALGSAAFAWSISKALQQPVLAIVPGYGVADVVQQALGGWFGFGLHDFLGTKTVVQNALANAAPLAAAIGRDLLGSLPDAPRLHGAPVFRYGSGSSDVLHALMKGCPQPFRLLVGHSKGALQIGNALRSLDAGRTQGAHVVTMGCPIAEDAPGATYFQYLGVYDALGQLNMWGNWPEHWIGSWHTTNPALPPAMPTAEIVREAEGLFDRQDL